MKIKKSIYITLLSAGILLGTARSHSVGNPDILRNRGFGLLIAACIGSHIADKKMQKKEGLAQTAIDIGKSSVPIYLTVICSRQFVSVLKANPSFTAQALNLLWNGGVGTLSALYAGNILTHTFLDHLTILPFSPSL